MKITVENITMDSKRIADEILDGILDDSTMTEIHNALIRFCTPYVPKQEGILQSSAYATPEYAVWNTPYAHYQYMGEVYGPNFPVTDNGEIMGWWSPAKKHPTGRELGIPGEWMGWTFGYTTPRTGHHWDEKMMQERGDKFVKQVENILIRRAMNG